MNRQVDIWKLKRRTSLKLKQMLKDYLEVSWQVQVNGLDSTYLMNLYHMLKEILFSILLITLNMAEFLLEIDRDISQ